MKVSAKKCCDGCGEYVAYKNGLVWHTMKEYVSVRGDDVTKYANYEDNTTPYKLHYCEDCWKAITKNIHFRSEAEPL